MLRINETNVTIMVEDMDRAVSFYESIGLRLKNRWRDHYAMVETAGLTIGLYPGGNRMPASKKISIGFMVDNADEAKYLLEKNSIPFERNDDKSGIYLSFRDPDGTALYLHCLSGAILK